MGIRYESPNREAFARSMAAMSGRNLNRMRTRMPDLYEAIQVQRNIWWAKKIDELLATNGTYFIGMGLLHVLGPDSIPRQLQRLKVVAPADLHESPRIEERQSYGLP